MDDHNLDTSNLFKTFESRGAKILDALGAQGKTNNTKSLRRWNLTEAAELIGRTPHTINKCEKAGKLKKPESTGNNQRIYPLSYINTAREHFNTRPQKADGAKPAVLAFTNFKGGVAKTTSAVHAAHFFARAGYRVLFIDGDSQASSTSSFGYAPDHDFNNNETLLPIFTEKASIKDSIIQTYWSDLDLVPANLGLYNVELTVPIERHLAKGKGEKFKIHTFIANAIEEVKKDYDIIIIDCPPSMSILNTNALYAATGLIIPCPPELPDVASMFQFFGMISGTYQKIPDKSYDFIRVLITKHDGGTMSTAISQALRKVYGTYVMRSEMYNTQVIKRARAESKSVYELESYKGSKKTLERAVQIVDDVNRELESLIRPSLLETNTLTDIAQMEIV